jgi:hypothetical protein
MADKCTGSDTHTVGSFKKLIKLMWPTYIDWRCSILLCGVD